MPSRILVNAFHPDLGRSRMNLALFEAAASCGAQTRVVGADLDIEAEQAECEAAEILVFLHPFHWYSGPWILKKWIDETLTYGWAYGGPDRLAGKKWLQAVTVGAAEDEYLPGGSRVYSVAEFLRPFERTAAFCRMEWEEPFLVFGSGLQDGREEEMAAMFKLRLLSLLDPP